MAQLLKSQEKRAFYRQTFEIKNNGVTAYRHTLLVNPEDMAIEEPNRATVTQTLGGAYLSLFGQGLHTVTISGKTGYHARKNAEGIITDGYEEIKHLRKHVYRDFINLKNSQMEMFWYNWEDEEYYKIIPLTMRIQRSVSGAQMYRYELQFTCIKALGEKRVAPYTNLLSSVDALEYGKVLTAASSSLSESSSAFARGGH